MKYIRTEKGICKNIYGVETIEELENTKWFFDKTILKQADTIEELCDEFVGILPNERPYLQFYRLMYNFDDIKAHYLDALSVEQKTEYYGAIWTDKGLIYVAKMNKKGELELI